VLRTIRPLDQGGVDPRGKVGGTFRGKKHKRFLGGRVQQSMGKKCIKLAQRKQLGQMIGKTRDTKWVRSGQQKDS